MSGSTAPYLAVFLQGVHQQNREWRVASMRQCPVDDEHVHEHTVSINGQCSVAH